jgi:cytidine deaminase
MITDLELMDRARGVAEMAYSPYSSTKVGCALVTESGRIYLGCNVENASYGLTMCAERVAIGRAMAEEGAGMRWVRAAVVALGLEFPPCGACRQVLAEFAMAESRVIFLSGGQPVSMGMADLLPAGFTPADLKG